MSGDFPFSPKVVNPIRCNEKPWDLWVTEIGHASPSPEEDGAGVFLVPSEAAAKGALSARRLLESHPHKTMDRSSPRYRRVGVNRLRHATMSLHGLFPQMDSLNAIVCHMCGRTVKCSAAYRHLLESHATNSEPLLPPPPPATTVKVKSTHSRSRHKKDPPPPPLEVHPAEVPPIRATPAPLPRIVLPQSDLQYLNDEGTAAGVGGEVQVCVEGNELPVVSIQDTAELPLTDDIFAIMNSEGIQSADGLADAFSWKTIIQDIGGMQDFNFNQAADGLQSDVYTPVESAPLPAYNLTEDLSSLQFAPPPAPMLSTVIDTNFLNAQALNPAPAAPTKAQPRPKSSKSKFNIREYDPNKHCGVITVDNQKPCTRSLTCKAHALSLRRTVEGRLKPFDILLAEHRASRDANVTGATAIIPVAPTPTAPVSISIPPSLLVNSSIDLSAFNGLTAEQQVNDIYTSLLNAEDPNTVLPDTSSITSLLSQALPADQFLLPEDAELGGDVPILSIASPVETTQLSALPASAPGEERVAAESPPALVHADICWYPSCPRPLAVCTYNASHAAGAVVLGKKFATVRSNIKSSLSRSQGKAASGVNSYYNYSQNSMTSLSKTVHLNNASKSNKPEVRKLIVTCSATSGAKEQTFSEVGYGSGEMRVAHNGHLLGGKRGRLEDADDARRSRPALLRNSLKNTKHASQTDTLELSFMFDPLLADEKC